MEPGQTIGDLYEERAPLYEKYADAVVTVGEEHTLEETVAAVLRALIKG